MHLHISQVIEKWILSFNIQVYWNLSNTPIIRNRIHIIQSPCGPLGPAMRRVCRAPNPADKSGWKSVTSMSPCISAVQILFKETKSQLRSIYLRAGQNSARFNYWWCDTYCTRPGQMSNSTTDCNSKFNNHEKCIWRGKVSVWICLKCIRYQIPSFSSRGPQGGCKTELQLLKGLAKWTWKREKAAP